MRAPELLPFFTFYGGKFRAAPRYPAPQHWRIIEPFAGSAGYSIRHPGASVWINDIDPVVTGTWLYLVSVSAEEILQLPDLEPGQTTDDLGHLPQEARWLIGWWLNKGSATPKKRASTFMLKHPAGAPYWGAGIRERIARQLPQIRHWTVTEKDYRDLPDTEATWFIDPPYSAGGQHYRHGHRGVDYGALAEWTLARQGQIVACEADTASWLPFQPLMAIDGNEGRQKKNRAQMEVLFTRSWEPVLEPTA
jgi:site-specific DNA-adenine methylase